MNAQSFGPVACAPAIRVCDLVKEYPVYDNPRQRLLSLILPFVRKSQAFRALDQVSFEVQRGETVGIIGRNGAGKSTLLQILCGTVPSTSGSVVVHGRLAALLELGAGFNPEFTGRDNVFLNASLLGLSRAEIEERLDAIQAFADIGDFFDRPVKTYSSGMFVRLAFAVAIHCEPDILIVDEALSVGDIRFQMKCLERIEAIRRSGATILFVSHSLEQIRRFCQRAIWLEGGRIKLQGEASFVADSYRDHEVGLETQHATASEQPQVSGEARHDYPAVIEDVTLSSNHLAPFDSLSIEVTYRVNDRSLPGLLAGVAIKGLDGLHIFGPNTHLEGVSIPQSAGRHRLTYHIPSVPLLSGTYRIDVGLFTNKGLVCLDYLAEAARLTVASPYFSEGIVYIQHEWRVHAD